MKHQVVSGKKTTPLMGVLLVAGILVGLIVLTMISNVLTTLWDSAIPAGCVWILAFALAVYLMKNRILEYHYTVNEGTVYIERVYGTHTKILLNIPLRDVLLLDTEENALARYPAARVSMNAVCKGCPLPRLALLYRLNGQFLIARVQPNEEMRAALYDPELRARLAREKWGE